MSSSAPSSSASLEVLQRGLIAGSVCAFVSMWLHPLDVIKIRLQTQKSGHGKYVGMISGIKRVYVEEGLQGLSKGLLPSMLREISYSGIRIGAYEPIRALLSRGGDVQDAGAHVKFSAGFMSGGFGAAICNPFDLLKTRFQSVLAHETPPYPSTWAGICTIAKHEGLGGLYKGWMVTSARAAVVTSAQVGSYDTIKNNILKKRFGKNTLLHTSQPL